MRVKVLEASPNCVSAFQGKIFQEIILCLIELLLQIIYIIHYFLLLYSKGYLQHNIPQKTKTKPLNILFINRQSRAYIIIWSIEPIKLYQHYRTSNFLGVFYFCNSSRAFFTVLSVVFSISKKPSVRQSCLAMEDFMRLTRLSFSFTPAFEISMLSFAAN